MASLSPQDPDVLLEQAHSDVLHARDKQALRRLDRLEAAGVRRPRDLLYRYYVAMSHGDGRKSQQLGSAVQSLDPSLAAFMR